MQNSKKKQNLFTAKNYLFFYAAAILIINLLLLNIPLVSVFGYEVAAVNGLIISFFFGIFSISFLKKNTLKLSGIFFSAAVFLLIPFLISSIYSLFTISCSFYDGFLFYFFITAPSFIIGAGLAGLAFNINKKYPRFLFVILYLLVLFIPFIEFYFNPQIFFYNPLFGYFPGTVYDEGIAVNLKLVIYRLINLLFFGAIFYSVFIRKNFISRKTLLTLTILLAALFLYLSPTLGFSSSVSSIKNELIKTTETKNFIIHYSDKADITLIKSIAVLHEYYYMINSKFFKEKLGKKIESFVFDNGSQKKRFFGSENADVAKPWLPQIYVETENYNSTLSHEIAHCFTANFGWGILKTSAWINPFLIEGAASAADPFYNENYIHNMAALGFENKYRINIADFLKGFQFVTSVSSIAYTYAGSFSLYLIENYGIEKFKQLYQTADLEETYSIKPEKIIKNYYEFLSTINIGLSRDAANYYFGRRSLFMKICPRYIATILAEGWENYYKKNFDEAAEKFNEAMSYGENYSALYGLTEILREEKKYEDAEKILKENIELFKNTSSYYNVEFLLADTYGFDKKFSRADSLYKKIIEQNPNKTLYILSNLRIDLIKSDLIIDEYLKGGPADKYALLKKINEKKYNYFSFPFLIELSKTLDEDYKLFLNSFNKTLISADFISSYALYDLSVYMFENLDFTRSRKMAALSLRFSGDENLNHRLSYNYNKANWIYYNGDEIISNYFEEKHD